jgi:O-antigen/teichoic acid export membrane protein
LSGRIASALEAIRGHLREDGRRFVAQVSSLLGGQLVAAILNFLLAVVLARELAAEEFGRYALIVAVVLLVAQLVDVRVWEAATRFTSEHLARGRNVQARAVLELALLVNLAAGFVATGLLAALADPIATELLEDPELTGALIVYAGIAPLLALENAAATIFRIFDRFGQLGALHALGAVTRLAAVAVVLAAGGGLEPVLITLLAAEAVTALAFIGLGVRILVQELPVDPDLGKRLSSVRGTLRPMARFLFLSNLTGTLRIFNERSDVVLVGALASPTAAGVFALARTFVQPMAILYRPLQEAIYPILFSAGARGGLAGTRGLVARTTRLAGALLLLCAAVLSLASPWLIPGIAGEGFADAWEAVIPLALGAAVMGSLFWLQAAALALDRQPRALAMLAVASAAQLAALLILIPPLGPLGAGLAYLIFSSTWAALLLPTVWRQMRDDRRSDAPSPAIRPPTSATAARRG